MSLKDEFKKMVGQLESNFSVPPVAGVFLPPFYKGGQPKDSQFIALALEGGATGISYILLPDNKEEAYNALQPSELTGRYPQEFALEFGSDDPVKEMISMASINAICQHVIKETNFQLDHATDPLGLISINREDRIGMVGFFSGLINTIRKAGAELVIIEKEKRLVEKYRDMPITTDITRLSGCNKILCTGTTVLNNSLDDVLRHCSPDAFISVVGPTAGYFPDPLFACGVDVVGGRVVKDSTEFMRRLLERKRWEDSTLKTCFQKNTYRTILNNR